MVNILDWWIAHAPDHEQGGFIGRMDGQGKIHPEAEKGIILNTRILWTFSAAARLMPHPEYRRMADRAFDYLLRHFWDKEEGGFLWTLDHRGLPQETKKQVYAQAFAIYSLSEYYLLSGEEAALNKASETFALLERFSRDREKAGYLEAYSRDWFLLDDLRLSEKDANEAKTMNTHLHLLEAYTNLLRANVADKQVQQALTDLITLFLDKFIAPETSSMHLFFDVDWQLKSHEMSFGHDIECSWLLTEAAEVLGNEILLEKSKHTAVQMANAVLTHGLDLDGGILNEAGPNGLTDTDKHWWPQAEGVVGFLNAWQISGETRYYDAAVSVWQFIERMMKDPVLGEWYWRVNRRGAPITSEDKVSQWKCPYHNGRACMEAMRRLT
ncbi:MAG: AGE family epimerase/isomerase [Saprospiraceae bacterium]|nr:AGE family epimerase/isomerase [Saprospiraceae bacterium]